MTFSKKITKSIVGYNRKELDALYTSAQEYQVLIFGMLKEIFGEEMVKSEWDSVTYDGHFQNHKSVYAPRIDIAIGPFNSYGDLDIGNDRTAVMKKHLLVERLNERYEISWNNLSRCFLAIEIVFSGSSKHIMGDFLNATSTGAIGIIVSRGKSHDKAKRMLGYLTRLEDYKRIHRMRNLMLFRDDEFLKFLEELKNPEKITKIALKKEHKITFQNNLLRKSFLLDASPFWTGSDLSTYTSKKLTTYGFQADRLIRCYSIIFGATKYTMPCSAWFYEVVNPKNERITILEIVDIAVKPSYRNKNIGKQIFNIFENIAITNNCQYICAELGNDSVQEPLESQKRFFERSGLNFWHDKNGEFSGWVGKKSLIK